MGATIRSDKVGRESQMQEKNWIYFQIWVGRKVEVKVELVILIQLSWEEIFNPFFLVNFLLWIDVSFSSEKVYFILDAFVTACRY